MALLLCFVCCSEIATVLTGCPLWWTARKCFAFVTWQKHHRRCIETAWHRHPFSLHAAVMAERARLNSEVQQMARAAMKDHDTQDQKLRRLLNYAVALENEVRLTSFCLRNIPL